MLIRVLHAEATFRRPRWHGVFLVPLLPIELFAHEHSVWTGVLQFPDGRRQEVHGRFFFVHYSGRTAGQPSWGTECFLKDITDVPEGAELWIDASEH